MELDAGAVDEEFVRHTVHSGELCEDALPHTSLGPAPETVVERLLRPVDILRAVSPAATALQRMDDPRQHAPVIDPRHPACVVRQSGSIRAHCSSVNQKKSAIHYASSLETVESYLDAAVNPVYGSGP